MSDSYRGAAQRIALRLQRQAAWDGDECSWLVRSTRRTDGGALIPAPPGIYQGTAGIGLFLAEAAALAGSDSLRDTALAALTGALRQTREGHAYPLSYYSGTLGVAFAAYRAGTLLRHTALQEDAVAALVSLAGCDIRLSAVDVIAGAAGAIPPLLWFAKELSSETARVQADRLGQQILGAAHRMPEGWCWPTMSTAARGLAGFAHGAAGIGSASLELWSATYDERYLFAAERAFEYERYHYDHEFRNWPDFRHQELGELVFEHRDEELRARLAAGEAFIWRRTPGMIAWCHGAAGIALSRARAYEVTGREEWRAECAAAAGVTAELLRSVEAQNYSLCHGAGGNCVAVLRAAQSLGEASLADGAYEALSYGITRYEEGGRDWPAGTYMGLSDPTLMLGEAGVGLAMLVASGLRLPYLLCFESAPPLTPLLRLPSTEHLLREEIRAHLGAAIDALPLPQTDPSALPAMLDGVRSVLEAAGRVAEANGTSLASLADEITTRSELELWSVRMLSSDLNILGEFTEGFMKDGLEIGDWDSAVWRLAAHVRAVSVRSCATASGYPDAEASTTGAPQVVLLIRHRDRVMHRDLSAFAGAVVVALREPRSLGELVGALQDAFDASAEELAPSARAQLEALYRADLVTRVRGSAGVRGALHAASVA